MKKLIAIDNKPHPSQLMRIIIIIIVIIIIIIIKIPVKTLVVTFVFF